MTRFERDTAVQPGADGLFKAEVSRPWWVVRGPHGGYLSAMVLRAMTAMNDDPDRHPRSFTTHFLDAPEEGLVEIACKVERSGRSLTTMSARMSQGPKPIALAIAAFSKARPGFEFDDAPMPEVGGPDTGFPVPNEGDNIPPFLGNFDMRWLFGDAPFSGGKEAVVGGWLRTIEPTLADAAAIACIMDAWAPAIFPRASSPVVAPTVDFTVHFRTAFPLENAAPDDFYLGRFRSALGRDGFFEEDGELWSKDGSLIAQSRQLALGILVG